MIAGLASSLPQTLTSGLQRQGVPAAVAHQIGTLPPVSSLFAAVLGVNPVQHLLAASGVLASLPAASRQVLTGREFFPNLISGAVPPRPGGGVRRRRRPGGAGRPRLAAARPPPHARSRAPRRPGRAPQA